MSLRRVAEWDFAPDYRRFWWVVPPLILAAALYLLLTAVRDDEVVLQERIRRTFPDAGAAPVIDIRNSAGRVRVFATRESGVEVVGTRRGIGKTEEEAFAALTALQTRVTGRDATIALTSTAARRAGGRSEMTVDLYVPPGARIAIEQAAGPVVIEGVLGDIVVTVGDGDILVELPEGRGFRLQGGGTLASDFALQLEGSGFVTRGREPVQDLRLSAPGSRVTLRARD